MLDSCSKMEPGLFHVHTYGIGSKEQCSKISENIRGVQIAGRYDLVNIFWPLPIDQEKALESPFGSHWLGNLWKIKSAFHSVPMTTAICYPSKCSKIEMESIIRNAISKYRFQIKFKNEVNASTDGTNIIWSIFVAQLLLVLLASTSNCKLRLIEHFDVRRNFRKLTEVKHSGEESIQRLAFFNFFKVFGVVAGPIPHYFSAASTISELFIRFFKLPEDSPISFNLIFTPMVSNVSTNILTASILSVFGWHQVTRQRSKVTVKTVGISFFEFSVMRMLRSLPVLLAIIGLALVFPAIPGSGMVFNDGTSILSSNCRKNAWLEMIYMSNILSDDIVSTLS